MNTLIEPLAKPFAASTSVQEIEREVELREKNYQRASKGCVHVGDDRIIVAHELDCLLCLERMENLSRRIVHRNEAATRVVKKRTPSGTVIGLTHELTSLGEAVWALCLSGIPMIELTCPSSRYKGEYSSTVVPFPEVEELAHTSDMTVRFNPSIAVLLRACQKAMPTLRAYSGDGYVIDVNNERTRRKLTWLVRFVRRVGRSGHFRRMESNRVRLERKDLESCCRYMASGFAEYANLEVLRVDLYIRPTHHTWADTRLAEQCMERYLRALSEDRIISDVKRWIWKRECGFDRGIHYHLLVALDGHKHQSANALGKMLGEAWVNRCGPLRASYFNCYVRRHEYKYNGLGSVHVTDAKKLIGIKKAIEYMVKGDGYVMTGHKRNLRKGNMPKDQHQPKRGAPRKGGHDMSLVNAILGNPITNADIPYTENDL
ncbi:YagK/YfjJ domain-containing protein [Dyella flagellata]|uniref:YagK/YfjJ C-terminal domain-containing protein n=1 Tax=Dyella flagellata TaxID=1867833 RepID=A0ABQ5X9I2_9GAMM|nr:inovirus-type Gp2 protein [Dyella flagellata]GLQ87253.1 hypothetical protein GCM10007898_08190 [Dyella flagellata]